MPLIQRLKRLPRHKGEHRKGGDPDQGDKKVNSLHGTLRISPSVHPYQPRSPGIIAIRAPT
jgi:hypothetical protein